MELLRAVARGRSGPHRRVRVHPLAGRGARKQLQEDFEVGEGRNELLDPEDRDENRRQSRAHPAVALGLDHAHGSRLGDAEVRTAHRHPRVQEPLPQIQASRLGELSRVVGDRLVGDRPPEDVADLRSIAMNRGNEDVRRPVAVELKDQLGQIGLDRVHPTGCERVVEADLVGGERLDLDELGDTVPLGDLEDDPVRLRPVARPVDVPAGAGDCRLELDQVLVEAREQVRLDRPPGSARSSSQSGTSATTRARLSRIVVVALSRFAPSCLSASASRAAAGNGLSASLMGRPPRRESPRDAACAPGRPHAIGGRRSEAGTSRRRPCRRRLRSTPSPGTCPRPSPTTCRDSSPQRCPRIRSIRVHPAIRRARGPSTAARSRTGASPTRVTRSEWQVG